MTERLKYLLLGLIIGVNLGSFVAVVMWKQALERATNPPSVEFRSNVEPLPSPEGIRL